MDRQGDIPNVPDDPFTFTDPRVVQLHPNAAVRPEPYALALAEFVARRLESRPPLLGTEEDNLLPAGGLLILVARGGKGKTTLSIDACFHLASGIEWLGFTVQRALRILIIENEGPVEPFRRKLERKASGWSHAVPGAIFVKTFNWGAFTVEDEAERKRLRAFLEQERIDLVVGDPLDSLGMKGVGSPAETRDFMGRLVEVGLTRDTAFWLLHHPTKAEVEDELDQASGAWGGRPDTMLNLSLQPGNRSRLSFPKVRWGSDASRKARILTFDAECEGFAVVAEEAEERDLKLEIHNLLTDGQWRTARDISNPRHSKNGKVSGIGANRDKVEGELRSDPEVFESRPGRDVGRRNGAVVWSLRDLASPAQTSLD